MIEKRADWPVLSAEIDACQRSENCAPLPSRELVVEILEAAFSARGVEISEDDIRFATIRVSWAADGYAQSHAIEERRPPASAAKARLKTVARLALDLMEGLVDLDLPAGRPVDAKKLMDGTLVPCGDSHVASVLEAALLARQDNEEAAIALGPLPKSASAVELPESLIMSHTVRRIFHDLSELAYAADRAGDLPLGRVSMPVWPLLRGPNAVLTACETAASEIAQMFWMMLGEVPPLARYRDPDDRRHGPLITPLRIVLGWVEERTGIPVPSAAKLEKALARAAKDPTSLLGAAVRRRPTI